MMSLTVPTPFRLEWARFLYVNRIVTVVSSSSRNRGDTGYICSNVCWHCRLSFVKVERGAWTRWESQSVCLHDDTRLINTEVCNIPGETELRWWFVWNCPVSYQKWKSWDLRANLWTAKPWRYKHNTNERQ